MIHSLERLRIDLGRASDQLERLLRSFDYLESDSILLQDGASSVYFCIDFHDLRSYLSMQNPLRFREANSGGSIREYVKILLLNQLFRPIVLLPPYYRELRSYIAKTLFASEGSELRAELWISRLRRQLGQELASPDGLFAYLAEVVGTESAVDITEVKRRASNLSSILDDVPLRFGEARTAALFIKRFDKLVSEKKVVSLSGLLPDGLSFRFAKDDIFFRSKIILDSLKKAESRRIPNENDAMAVSIVGQLNSHPDLERRTFFLVSSADSMLYLTDRLNEALRADGRKTIELRDLDYWTLWFALTLRSSGEGKIPLDQVSEFRRTFKPILSDLYKACKALRTKLNENVNSVTPEFLSAITSEIEAFAGGLAERLRDIAQPVLDPKWALEMVREALSPVSTGGLIEDSIRLIRHLIEDMGISVVDLEARRRELQGYLVELTRVLEVLERQVRLSVAGLDSVHGQFGRGYAIDEEDLRPPYSEFVRELDMKREKAASRILLELLTRRSERAPEADLLLVQIFTIEGKFEDALRRIREFKRAHGEWDRVRLLEAVCQMELNLLEEAAATLDRLLLTIDNSRVRLLLAKVFWRWYLRTEEQMYLKKALEHAEEAYVRRNVASVVVRAESSAIYYAVLLRTGEMSNGSIKEAIKELDDQIAECIAKDVAESIIQEMLDVRSMIESHPGKSSAEV